MQPPVSIIIPCYNAARWISQCIDSCLAQSYGNIEILVVDDGSTDASVAEILHYGDVVRLFQIPHSGAAAARNHGFRHSRGECIQFLDSDDMLDPAKIATQMAVLSGGECDIIYGDWCAFTIDPVRDRRPTIAAREYTDYVKIFLEDEARTFIPPGAFLYQRGIIEAVDAWDEEIDTEDDHHFKLKLALHGARFRYRPGGLFFYRREHQAGMSDWFRQVDRRSAALSSITRLYDKVRLELERHDMMTPLYARILTTRYESLARQWLIVDPSRTDSVRRLSYELRKRHASTACGDTDRSRPDKLMIVAHPDDETVFGGAQLLSEEGWKVVCITNAANVERRDEFRTAMHNYGHAYEMWNYPDEMYQSFECDQLRSDLERVVNERNWSRMVTHNAEGEYDHPHHILIHRIVSELAGERLQVFDCKGERLADDIWSRKLEMIGIYDSQSDVCDTLLPLARRESLTGKTEVDSNSVHATDRLNRDIG